MALCLIRRLSESSMEYRPYQPRDFTALYALEESCFSRPHRFPRRYMRQLIANPRTATWVALDESGALAGFAIVEPMESEAGTMAYIETLEVDPAQRRKGVGSGLVRHCIASALKAGAAAVWLHVAEDNRPARALYQAYGFAEQGRQRHYYGRGRDGLVLALALASAAADGAE